VSASLQAAYAIGRLVERGDHDDWNMGGLLAGADDFLTKPVNDLQLISRVKSLLRLKTLSDELRIRADTAHTMGIDD
ncbi:PleD family two-component system response regulator, partial [Rhizobium ruizarguesonis]